LWEAFLLQMNDFDRYLELQLRRMLDPVVVTRPPRRKGLKESPRLLLAVDVARVELVAEAVPVVEPVVALPVAPARAL
jgi:hypothetical protein